MPHKIEFTVNGQKCQVDECLPRYTSLNAYIRYTLALPGTKAMCHEGGCGSCIVMVRAKRPTSGKIETFSVNSCLVLVFSCHGWDITTVEYLGNRKDGYSEVQKRIAAFNGSQCGYCTPGWVMHLTSLIDKHLTMEELEKSFGSNTCRCTGFRPIYDAIQSFAIDPSPTLCQRVKDIEDLSICDKSGSDCDTKCSTSSVSSDWSLLNEDKSNNTITLNFGDCKFFKVFDEDAIFDILNKHGMDSYMFIDGNTGKGIVENFEYPSILIDISAVASLKGYDFDQNMVLGANVSLEDAIKIFKETSKTRTDFAYLAEFVKHFELVAHIPVRKIGSIAGNLMYKRAVPTYQSDLFVMFECVGAYITIRDSKGVKTTLRVTEFLHYDMRGMLMINIELPPLSCSHIYRSYKVMPRNQNALAIVNAAFLLETQGNTHKIKSASIVYGNIDPRFVHASKTENFLIGKNIFSDDVLQQAIRVLCSELIPAKILGEPSKECRKKLGLGLFYKFILNIAPPGAVLSKYKCGGELLYRPVSKGTPDYQTYPNLYPLNKPIIKLEAQIQSAGEATYSNDIPPLPREVFAAFVQSTVHNGEVDAFDIDHLMAIEGVVALFTPKDIPGVNSFTMPGLPLLTVDEEILATKIKFYGQPIAVVVAKTEKLAADVAKKVKVTYKNVSNVAPVLTIDAAKKDSSRYIASKEGINPTRRGTDVKKVIKGMFEQGAQYRYYLEPITCVVIPVDDRLEIHDASQWIDLAQIAVARSLAISESEIIIKVRRVGGGFGGKLSRQVQATTACALVAKKLNVPCRFILPMQTNLTFTGKRMPAQCDYEVGVDDNGKIQYLNATILDDKGCSENDNVLSFLVPGFAHCYNTDTWTLRTANILTDTPCNTFYRAPGTTEGIASIEHIMQHIAFVVDKDPTEVRKINMRTEDNDLPELIDTLKSQTDYEKRVIEIKNFNKANRWVKKAISVNIMLFPVIFYGNYSAFVSIYRGDGTVTVSFGGIEMGQGINTKAAQVCAYELEIPLEFVKIIPHYSFIAANNIFSGSSIVTESVSYAIIKACEVLKERLAPVRASMPDRPWKDIISRAADEQINLCAHYMMRDTDPALQDYSAFGVVILETELDVLTGRFQITRTDILEDVGISGNPKLDVGQVEGAFVQGLGFYTCEKLVYDEHTGKLLTNRSLKYHVPLGLDIPIEYNVKLRYNSKNTKGVLGSKTCGEMGISLAHSINHVLRSCIMESRKDSGYDPKEWLNIPTPYDTERILKALNVKPEEFLLRH